MINRFPQDWLQALIRSNHSGRTGKIIVMMGCNPFMARAGMQKMVSFRLNELAIQESIATTERIQSAFRLISTRNLADQG